MEQLKNIRLVLCDLDGTLLNDEKKLDSNIFKVIKEKNIMISFVTGRNMHIVKDFIDQLDIQIPYCTNNGATIFAGDSCIFQLTLSKEDFRKSVAILNKHQISFLAYTNDKIFVNNYNPQIDFMINRLKNKCQIHYDVVPYIIDIFKITIIEDHEEKMKRVMDEINSSCDESHCFRSEGNIYTLTHKNANKGTGTKKIIELLHLNQENVIVFGDNYNDITMFQAVENSVAMANSPLEVKKVSHFTAQSNNENGVSKFIEKYVL